MDQNEPAFCAKRPLCESDLNRGCRNGFATDQIVKRFTLTNRMQLALFEKNLFRATTAVIVAGHDKTIGPRDFQDQQVANRRGWQTSLGYKATFFLRKNIAGRAERSTDNDVMVG